MAELFSKGLLYYVRFRHEGRIHKRSCKTGVEKDARVVQKNIEVTVQRVRAGLLKIPAGVDPGDFIFSGGTIAHEKERATVAELLERFLASSHHLEKAKNTRSLERIHVRHLSSILGAIKLRDLSEADLQAYIDRRKADVVGKTILKEFCTLRVAWNTYGRMCRLVESAFSQRFPVRLKLPKHSQKPPFRPLWQIPPGESRRSVYLLPQDVSELLRVLQAKRSDKRLGGPHAWVYPAVCYCLYTSFRRSSMLRQRVSEIDFNRSTITARVTKEKSDYVETFRTIPLLPALENVLNEWLDDNGPGDPPNDPDWRLRVHPGGEYLFCERLGVMLTPEQAHHGLRRWLAGTGFEGIGWHTFRHSFVSCAAMRGVPLPVVQEFTGHTSVHVLNIYKHLAPDHLRQQVEHIYGEKKK